MSDSASAHDAVMAAFLEQCRQFHYSLQDPDVVRACTNLMERFTPSECLIISARLQQLIWAQMTMPEIESAIQERETTQMDVGEQAQDSKKME